MRFIYKGMLTTTPQLRASPDLQGPAAQGARARCSRFSTNTFPSWDRWPTRTPDRPQRRDQHRPGQHQLDAGREALSSTCSHAVRRRPQSALPDLHPSSLGHRPTFDEVLELLHLGGQPRPRGADDDPRGVGRHGPMDPGGPGLLPVPRLHHGAVGRTASVTSPTAPSSAPCSTATACARRAIWVCDDGLVVMASEVGVLDRPGPRVRKGMPAATRADVPGRHRPGRIIDDAEIKARELAAATPTASGWRDSRHLDDLPQVARIRMPHHRVVLRRARPSATPRGAQDPDRADGAAPAARADRLDGHRHAAARCCRPGRGCCSTTSSSCSRQVTNPPLDAIREEVVTSLQATIGPGQPARPGARVVPPDRAAAADPAYHEPGASWSSSTPTGRSAATSTACARRSSAVCIRSPGGEGLAAALDDIPTRRRRRSPRAPVIVLSDRTGPTPDLAPIPSLLAVAAVHHHLVRQTRTQVGLIVEAGDAARFTTSRC